MFTDPNWRTRRQVFARGDGFAAELKRSTGRWKNSSPQAAATGESCDQHKDALGKLQDPENTSMLRSPIGAPPSEQCVRPTNDLRPGSLNASAPVAESTSHLYAGSAQGDNSPHMPVHGTKDIRNTSVDIFLEGRIVRPLNRAKSATSELGSSEENIVKIDDTDKSYQIGYPLDNVAARGPIFDYSLPLTNKPAQLEDFHNYFRASTSTSDDLMDWLMYQQDDQSIGWKHSMPGSAIFNILQSDTMDFLQMVDSFLDQIEASLLDETMIQKMLPTWRSHLTRISKELQYLKNSTPRFANFLTSVSGWQSPIPGKCKGENTYDIQGQLLPEIMSGMLRLETRIKTSSQDLISSVSIIESRKGIAEAESIAKLTELGWSFRQFSPPNLCRFTETLQHSSSSLCPSPQHSSACKSRRSASPIFHSGHFSFWQSPSPHPPTEYGF
jgi:hypothetical protein